MGYYKPLFRRPVYRDWPVIVGGWLGLLAAVAFGLTRGPEVDLAGPVLVGLIVFGVSAWLIAFVRQRITRWSP